MKIMDLNEAPEYSSLISQINRSVLHTIEEFIATQLKGWRATATSKRREKLGYHPYKESAQGFKTFNQDEYDKANENWGLDSDGVGDSLDEFIPTIDGKQTHSPVYALMGKVSDSITKITQNYIRSKYGDPINLNKHKDGSGTIVRNVNDVRVLIWWSPRNDVKGGYKGVYRRSSHNINVDGGIETLLEIIIDRVKWSEMLRNEVGAILSYDKSHLGDFSQQIINTYIHELAHLEQDIRGNVGKLRLIPGKKKNDPHAKVARGNTFDWQDDFERYLSSTAEIDSHASGAAAEVINQIINQHAEYGARYKRDTWSANDIDTNDWNEAIKDAVRGVSYGEIPRHEYAKYIESLDRRYKDIPDETIKDKFLKKVRQKFIKSYVNRLNAYLRPAKQS